jgi:hypothetical protein
MIPLPCRMISQPLSDSICVLNAKSQQLADLFDVIQ